MTVYYNEIDPFAAAWLRELIEADQIAPGIVDERSIEDVTPNDLAGFTQCHFFAGIGVWSYALRRAGWPDDRPIWTGSCPCQPFSAAGKGDGFDDERHLWPAWFHLITQCGPDVVVGEQVSSKDGLAWLDLVQADMEAAGFAFGALDICAAGVGAPHIRQRGYFAAIELADGVGQRRVGRRASEAGDEPGTVERLERLRDAGGLDDERERRAPGGGRDNGKYDGSIAGATRENEWLADGNDTRLEKQRGPSVDGGQSRRIDTRPDGPIAGQGAVGGMAIADGGDASAEWQQRGGEQRQLASATVARELDDGRRPGPTNGIWGNVDWLFCRDGKWRPVEPGTFPLAHGAPARVGRLRGYGNGIVAPQATAFIETLMEIIG